MRSLIYAGCVYAGCLAAVFAAADHAVAQQQAVVQIAKRAAASSKTLPPDASGQDASGAFIGYCGQWIRCYSGIPLRCGENTRPYQNIAKYTCLCVHNGCPQQ